MARTSKSTAAKTTQSDSKGEYSRSNAKADGTLAFGIVAGAMGLSIAMMENAKAAAAENSAGPKVGTNDATASHAVGAQSAYQVTGHEGGQLADTQAATLASVELGDMEGASPSIAAIPANEVPATGEEPVPTEHSKATSDGVEEVNGSPDATAEAGQDQTEVANLAASEESGSLADNSDLGATLTDALDASTGHIPLTDILAPVLDTLQPVMGLVDPLLDALAPVTELVDSIVDALEPVTNILDPVIDLLDPVVDIASPVLGALEPVTNVLEPVVGALEPVTDIISPISGVSESLLGEGLAGALGLTKSLFDIAVPTLGFIGQPIFETNDGHGPADSNSTLLHI